LGASFLTFIVLILLPGDPAIAVLGENATPVQITAFRAEHHLDQPILERYASWIGHAVTGDLGHSYADGRPVTQALVERIPVSLELVLVAQIFALVIAIPLALLTVSRRGRWTDRAVTLLSLGGLSLPTFVLAYVLILFFAVRLNWFPATGFTHLSDGPLDNVRSVLLPAITLALPLFATYIRLLRNEMLSTLSNDFVTTAHGKGLSAQRVLIVHVFRGSLFSLITIVGLNFGALLGGTVITETIFAVPGVGRLLIEAISKRDSVTVQGVVLFIATCYVVINVLVDLLYSFLDPRIRHGRNHG
jgi:peptide/nickel transport system permease protein